LLRIELYQIRKYHHDPGEILGGFLDSKAAVARWASLPEVQDLALRAKDVTRVKGGVTKSSAIATVMILN
jgi:hypothetical protein